MTELIVKKVIPKRFLHSHDTDYWCTKGGHWVPKDQAERNADGKLMCPLDHGWLRTNTRIRLWKHEERIVRY
jgi:hypothetical protein